MRIATWNVNSVKARQERLLAWLERHAPDVLCLQELKGTEEKFPFAELAALGYYATVFGQKTYNGVAILARQEPSDIQRGMADGVEDPEARLISAKVGRRRIICVYVPNGQDVGSGKYAYKLAWLCRLRAFLATHHAPEEDLVLCGDFNCAPEDIDVHDPDAWRDTVLTHPDVRDALGAIVAWGLGDTFRHQHPDQQAYSWWDYRRLGFPKNRGLRIDLILATAPLVAQCSAAWIDREERKGAKPSDHAPVVVDI